MSKYFVILLSTMAAAATAEENETSLQEQDPNYGVTWLYFPDDAGEPLLVNLTTDEELVPRMGSGSYGSSDDVRFFLYTRDNPQTGEELFADDEGSDTRDGNELGSGSAGGRAMGRGMDPGKLAKVVTHGWMSSGTSSTVLDIKDAYLRAQDVNVVIVDWQNLADNRFYPIAALQTREAGTRLALLLDAWERGGLQGGRVHLIGHSLGAHVMGYAGQFSNGTISRITGLDPARPMFEFPPAGPQRSLDPSDAQFVDVIHTCSGVLGYAKPNGHADFYPNHGSAPQPGCFGLQQFFEACSHGRSHRYFAESIESEVGFVAYPCDGLPNIIKNCSTTNETLMGEPAAADSRGVYYLRTNAEEPYARGYADSGDSGGGGGGATATRDIKLDKRHAQTNKQIFTTGHRRPGLFRVQN